MRIYCPICGERDSGEFTYGGDATVHRPAMDETDVEAWCQYVYNRENPRGPMLEYWHHTQGCRAWLVLERDTVTHKILSQPRLVGPWADQPAADTTTDSGSDTGSVERERVSEPVGAE